LWQDLQWIVIKLKWGCLEIKDGFNDTICRHTSSSIVSISVVALEMVPPDISFEFYRKPSIKEDRNELPPGDWRADSLKRCMAARSLRAVIAMMPVWSGIGRIQVRGCVAQGTELDSKDSMKVEGSMSFLLLQDEWSGTDRDYLSPLSAKGPAKGPDQSASSRYKIDSHRDLARLIDSASRSRLNAIAPLWDFSKVALELSQIQTTTAMSIRNKRLCSAMMRKRSAREIPAPTREAPLII
jgi:hypothetical protein